MYYNSNPVDLLNFIEFEGEIMNNYVLSCCSTVDLSKQDLQERNISYIPFHFFMNEKHFYDDLGETIPLDEFYQKLKEGVDVKTSQVNSEEFIEYFTPFLKDGKDILHICLSSGISGVYGSALIAQKELQQQFPERKIYIVDSLGGSAGYGLIMDKLAKLKNDENYSIDLLRDWIEQNKLKLHHWFTSTDLSFYVKGGRISKASGFVGGLLKICPVLNVSKEGKLTPILKVRSKPKALLEMLNKMVENAQDGLDYSENCFISHSACYEDARTLADLIEQKFPKMSEKVKITDIGPTIGSHCGPGTIALFFWGKSR